MRPRLFAAAMALALLGLAPRPAAANPPSATARAARATTAGRVALRRAATTRVRGLRRASLVARRDSPVARRSATHITVYDVGDSFSDAAIAHATLAASNRPGDAIVARPGRTALKTLRTQRTVRAVYRQIAQTAGFFEHEFGWTSRTGAMTAYVSGEVANPEYAYFDPDKDAFFVGQGMASLIAPYRVRDITPHELAHDWVFQTTGLGDDDGTQAGAWNEHIADAFSVMQRQSLGRQTFASTDWRIGVGARGKTTAAERSFAEPDADDLGIVGVRTMADYRADANEFANAGIPSHWFYLAAERLGGATYRSLGHVVFEATERYMRVSNPGFRENAFAHYAAATMVVASEMAAAHEHGIDAHAVASIRQSWLDVGIDVDALHATPGLLPRELATRLAHVTAPRADR